MLRVSRPLPALTVLLGLCFPHLAVPQGMGGSGARALPKPKPSGTPWPVSFTDVASSAGLQFRFTSGNPARKKYIIEANGSGVAFVDFNNDTLLDIFLVNGSRLEGFPAGKAPTNRLYRNEGGGRFRDVTEESGMGYAGWGNGVCAGDFDSDGYVDLYITYFGRNLLHRNKGDGTFAEVAQKAGVAGTGREWSTGCTFIDYDRDGRLDLFVTHYVGFDIEKAPLPGASSFCLWKGSPVFCGPRGLPYGSVALYRNRGDGAFEDATVSAGLDSVKGCYAFTAVAADFSGDGWTDIYVACDTTPSVYLRNEKNGKFGEIGAESGLAFNEDGAEQAGMGVGVGDFDNDGLLDITKTNFTGDYPNLYRSLGKNVFADIAVRAGLAVNPNHVLWGTAFVDLDNNGWKDLLQVSGHVYPEVSQIDNRELFTAQRLVYRNLGNRKFEDVSAESGAGILAKFSSRGAAFGDFDNDGDIDVLVMNMHEAPSLLRNDLKSSNHWVKLALEGTKSNRSAIGATVTIETAAGKQTDAVLSQSSFLSQNDFRLHFGLGGEPEVKRITVRWPSGDVEEFPKVSAGAMYLLVEGTGTVRLVELKR